MEFGRGVWSWSLVVGLESCFLVLAGTLVAAMLLLARCLW